MSSEVASTTSSDVKEWRCSIAWSKPGNEIDALGMSLEPRIAAQVVAVPRVSPLAPAETYRILANVEGELAGFDLGNVEHGTDKPQQVLPVGVDAAQGIHRFIWQRTVEKPSCMSSAYPRMAASGVVGSWLMLATNWFLTGYPVPT